MKYFNWNYQRGGAQVLGNISLEGEIIIDNI